jgi:hypothetical protein
LIGEEKQMTPSVNSEVIASRLCLPHNFKHMLNRTILCGAAILVALVGTGCDELDCLVSGDNVHGRVTFGVGTTIHQGTNILVQWSADSFSSVTGTTTESNMHGLVTVPFGMCVTTNTDYQLRAFQDFNGNGQPDTGEARGLYDGVNGSDGAYITVRVGKDSQNAVTDYGPADIALDLQ